MSQYDLADRAVGFLDTYYRDEVLKLAERYPREQQSLTVEYHDILQWDANTADALEEQPGQVLAILQEALASYDLPVAVDLSGASVRVTDTHGLLNRLAVDELRPEHIGRYVAVSGVAGKLTQVEPYYLEIGYRCLACNVLNPVEQHGPKRREPSQCSACERRVPFTVDYSESTKVPRRLLHLDLPPEKQSGTGQTLTVDIRHDLCEDGISDRLGDRLVVFGQLMDEFKTNDSRATELILRATAIEYETTEPGLDDIDRHREQFEELAARPDAYDLVRESVAPNLVENDELEHALTGAWMFLFGSPRIESESETRRGDIHMLMVGDPATGKSTILDNASELSPHAEKVSGNTVTGAGLTDAADHDPDLGWYIEPGVLPRANGGHAFVDEIDKASIEAMGKLHSAMEGEQRIHVAKATVRASMNTRCGLMAAANPEHGRFDPHLTLAEQIDMDAALLSRFDLTFTVTDTVEEKRDRAVSRAAHQPPSDRKVPTDVLRSWIAYARANVDPSEVTPEAQAAIEDGYADARTVNQRIGGGDVIPVTARWPHNTRRLAMASARLQLRETVTVEDVERAIEVQRAVLADTAFDVETSTFNASRADEAAGKKLTSQARRRALVRDVINDLDEGEGAPVDEVIAAMADHGVPEDQAEADIEHFHQNGSAYEPETGRIRWSG